jgi:hypothetical protein
VSVKHEYRCNLCEDVIPNYTDGIGLIWSYDTISTTLIDDSNDHMCSACCRRIKEMFAELDRHEAMREEREAVE